MSKRNRDQWHRLRIQDVCAGLYDGPHATPRPSEAGPVFLGIENITEDGLLDLTRIRHIAEEDFPQWTKRVLPMPGDIVFSYEATLNRYAIIPAGFRGCLGRRLALLRPDPEKCDFRFLHYYFFGEEWRRTVGQNLLIGSTVDRIPISRFPTFPITVPPVDVQRRIGSVLSAFDDLIENNTRRIAILEEMARALYREWFVNYRFPGYRGTKYAESPLGLLPVGWQISPLSVLAEVNARTIRRGSEPERVAYVDIASVASGNIEKVQFMPFKDAPGRARRIVRHGDVIWSCVRPNRRSYALIIDPDPELVVSTGFAVLSATGVPFAYLYHAVTTDDFVAYLTNHATGAAYPAVTAKDFEAAQVLMPPSPLLDQFQQIVQPLLEQQDKLRRKITILSATRDLLLPKLISGELDVSRLAETPVEAAV